MFAIKRSSIAFVRSTKILNKAYVCRPLSVAKIIYTETDEAPALATYALLPVLRRYAETAGIKVEKSDISLAGRIISQFPDKVAEDKQIRDELAELGALCKTPEANVIKLPNISASIPQLNAAIAELRGKGYDIPLYPQTPKTDEEHEVASRYAKVLGSAVNPVLREGNSDRRVAAPVKQYAQKNPHKMGIWSRACKTHVAHMTKGDFFGSEQSAVMSSDCDVKVELVGSDGNQYKTVLKSKISLLADEVIDAATMSVRELVKFLEYELDDAKKSEMMASLHLKATMMKVSDPIMFGHAVKTFYKKAFHKHEVKFTELGINPNNGLQDVFNKIKALPDDEREEIENDIADCYNERPWLAMVNSARGVTNLHVPSDVIIDASMPCVIRDSGHMWNKDDELEDVKCIIPDRCYATTYQEMISYVKANNQFDVSTMGSVANVGLMAQKAEEYGSHDKTFEIPYNGTVYVTDIATGKMIFEHKVEHGDIWRMCQTKDAAIRDWVRLAVSRARHTGDPAIFWLDNHRAHDRSMIDKVNKYLPDHDTTGLNISIKKPVDAMRESMERCTEGLNTISVTGNVLRDYLTDLFPILELGTSAKMLSIVPLLAGGGMFETGAGGSAPKHVDQFLKEGHLRWDSLGEYLAIAVSLDHMAETTNNPRAKALGNALNEAVSRLLANRKSPSRRVNELDNRASTFYVALYWAEALAKVDPDFADLAKKLQSNRAAIVEEFKACQGKPVNAGGYYKFDDALAEKAMRPSRIFNDLIDNK
eukprot:CAMPEP_0182428560 /NCGR_PEP_ID=MMETSP1167-20130531/23110_1 /TAXON_ID=2988 /ORGANISM="Mallomonas Sp, Strain CCMP3275" /LENGTH=763 /DNA_ID=CAMNT_0024611523 /DNA_START=65 /DNA_END=2356 /DNA_ORIENTATION=+